MKKILLVLLFLSLVFTLGCTGEDYKVVLKYEDGSEYKVETYSEGLKLDTLTKEGHDFLGWYNSQDEVVNSLDGLKLDGDITLYAKFKAKEFTYKFMSGDEVIKEEKAKYGSTIYYPDDPVKEPDEKNNYVFVGWDKEDTILKEDIVFNAVFSETLNEYTVKFVVDGTIIKEEKLKYNSKIEFPEEPVKESTNKFAYKFIGWDNESTVVLKDEVFNAEFEEILNEYTIKFLVDGTVVKEIKLPYEATIEFPEDPQKESQYGYPCKFIGWDNETKVVLKDEVFNAKFEDPQTFTYIFIDEEGNVIKEETAEIGAEIVYPENPSKDSDVQYDYAFTGWDRDDKVLTEDIIFEAKFSSTLRKYTCKFVDEDGEILKEELVEYGTVPTEPSNPTKDATDEYDYVFIGWDKRITEVTGDVTYTAKYEQIKKKVITSLEGKKISFLGDSITTFYADGSEANSYYTEKDTYYYPTYSSTIKTVDKTWWYQLYKNTNMTLGINNSWSGTCAEEYGDRAGYSDARINTLDDNGNPDIIIVYLGTNDNASGVSMGGYKSAINKIIDKIRNLSDAQIYLVAMGYSAYTGMYYKEQTRIEYNEVLRDIASTRKCGIIPLDEYVVEANYQVYLQDFLHYNAKGAELLSKVAEKAIKEYNGIEFNEEIKVEMPEPLPEGTLGKIQATAQTGFWTNDGYKTNVYFNVASGSEVAQFSQSYEITKGENGKYYVTQINKSGDKASYNCDYVLMISELNEGFGSYLSNLEKVVVGAIVEFDLTQGYPLDILFLEGDGNGPEGTGDPEQDIIEGQLHVGAYNTGIWTLYNSSAIAYEYSKVDQASTYINFYIIKLNKNTEDGSYTITGLKDIDIKDDFATCDIYIFIYRDHQDKTYFENAKLNGKVVVTGDITSGNCNLKFE